MPVTMPPQVTNTTPKPTTQPTQRRLGPEATNGVIDDPWSALPYGTNGASGVPPYGTKGASGVLPPGGPSDGSPCGASDGWYGVKPADSSYGS